MCEIRIYVADLAAYNNGKLHGVWINANLQPEEIVEQINIMLAKSPATSAKEWAIHDYEGFGVLRISEFEDLEVLSGIAQFIEENGCFGMALLDHWCGDINQAEQSLEDNYCGEYESLAEYARELTEETGNVPAHLEFYIDYESMGRDMELNGDIFTIETGYQEVHVFWNH